MTIIPSVESSSFDLLLRRFRHVFLRVIFRRNEGTSVAMWCAERTQNLVSNDGGGRAFTFYRVVPMGCDDYYTKCGGKFEFDI